MFYKSANKSIPVRLLTVVGIVLFWTLRGVSAARGDGGSPAATATTSELRALSEDERREGRRVRVDGVIVARATVPSNGVASWILRDAAGWIPFEPPPGEAPILGRKVRITGKTTAPWRFPAGARRCELAPKLEASKGGETPYVDRWRGYLTPPATGLYEFWISSDDGSILKLGDGPDPDRALNVARVDGWTKTNAWDDDQLQHVPPRRLEQGRRYYLEVLHFNASGDDHVDVAWSGPGIRREVVPGRVLTPWSADLPGGPVESEHGILREEWPGLHIGFLTELAAHPKTEERGFVQAESIVDMGPDTPGEPSAPEKCFASPQDLKFAWSEWSGSVVRCSQADGETALEINQNGVTCLARIADTQGHRLHGLLKSSIRIRGYLEARPSITGVARSAVLWAPGIADIDLIAPDNSPARAVDEVSFENVLTRDGGPARFHGTVVKRAGDASFWMENDDALQLQASWSPDCATWELISRSVIGLGEPLLGGLFVVSHVDSAVASAHFSALRGLDGKIRDSDFGSPAIAGSAVQNDRAGSYIIKAGGLNVWGAVQQGHWLYSTIGAEQSEISVRIDSFDPKEEWSKAGIMIRDSTHAHGRYATLALSRDHGVEFQTFDGAPPRTVLGGGGAPVAAPVYLRLGVGKILTQVNLIGRRPAPPVGAHADIAAILEWTPDGLTAGEAFVSAAPVGTRPPARDPGSPEAAIRNVGELLETSPLRLLAGIPVELRGVVTSWRDEFFYLSEGDRTVEVHYLGRHPEPGDVVRITGRTVFSTNERYGVELAAMTLLGKAALPDPAHPAWNEIISGSMDAQWVELSGLVSAVTSTNLTLTTDFGMVIGEVSSGISPEMRGNLLGSTVSVRGACLSLSTEIGRAQTVVLCVSSPEAVGRIQSSRPDRFGLAAVKIADLPNVFKGPAHAGWLKVRGIVTAVRDRSAFVEEERAAVRINATNRLALEPGDVVEAVGMPALKSHHLELDGVAVRKVGNDSPPPAEWIGPTNAPDVLTDRRRVVLEAEFTGQTTVGAFNVAQLRHGERLFRATLPAGLGKFPEIRPGSTVRAEGLCVSLDAPGTVATALGPPFELWLASPGAITVSQVAPWWTRSRFFSALIASLFIIAGAAWVIGLLTVKNAELREAKSELVVAKDRLESRVVERTMDLNRANQDLIRSSREAEAARAAAEAANRAKSAFLARMSHELRTPLNGVVGMVSLLMETGLSDEQRNYAETAQTSADSLLKIIDDILDLSKVESGKLTLTVVPFELREVVEVTLANNAAFAERQEVDLWADISPRAPLRLAGDPRRLCQVLGHLVDNAVKFTHGGRVVVQVGCDRSDALNATLRFAISDTGIGIPPEAHARLFSAFEQVDGSSTRTKGGAGIGLAISKRLVKLMGGDIGFTSKPGEGSTFWFTARVTCESDSPPLELLPPERVLVAANDGKRDVLARDLGLWGLDVELVEDASATVPAARKAAREGAPFLAVVVDLGHYPTGLDLARRLAADDDAGRPALILAAPAGGAGDAGAPSGDPGCRTVPRPMRARALFDAIQSSIGDRRRRRALDADLINRR